jgi:hypothetical protein
MRASPQAQRVKSRGTYFDVDLGGYLGLGVRVARSYEGSAGVRLAKEQALLRAQLLETCKQEDAAAVATAAAGARASREFAAVVERHEQGRTLSVRQLRALRSGGTLDGRVSDGVTWAGTQHGVGDDGAEAEAEDGVTSGKDWARVSELLQWTDDAKLDYGNWRWYGEQRGWGHVRPGAQARPGSQQELSGWLWGMSGWSYAEPRGSDALVRSTRALAGRAAAPVRSPRGRFWFRVLSGRLLPKSFGPRRRRRRAAGARVGVNK